ncbi:MAG: hypothetical protein FD180_5218 [Planctomycetota bacterium]|nr:MAG: hypothetical protein FD180_5218 [Planctomycetota bacterium]
MRKWWWLLPVIAFISGVAFISYGVMKRVQADQEKQRAAEASKRCRGGDHSGCSQPEDPRLSGKNRRMGIGVRICPNSAHVSYSERGGGLITFVQNADGVRVLEVDSDSLAARIGLQPGDVIVGLASEGEVMGDGCTPTQLITWIAEVPPGATFRMQWLTGKTDPDPYCKYSSDQVRKWEGVLE